MKTLIKVISFLYILFCIVLYVVQDNFIFNPEHIEESFKFRMGQEVEIPLDNDISMNALLVSSPSNAEERKAILYLHGNRGSIRFGVYQIRTMLDKGYDILVPDYRGYGKTEGEIESETQLLEDVEKAYKYLLESYLEDNIIVIGYSLGSGMASHLAAKFNPAHLLMVAPFSSLTDIKNQYLWFVPDFLLKFKLDTEKNLKQIKCPVSIVHGTEDRVVRFKLSEKLKEKYPKKVNLVPVVGQGHRRIIFDNALEKTLSHIIFN